MTWWHKNPIEAALWMQTNYPQHYARALEQASVYATAPELNHEALLNLKIRLERDSLTPTFSSTETQ
jgi:hypothetical protein